MLSAQDSRLELVLQALDTKGNWRNIEYVPNSWCGNSYHPLALEPGFKWNFSIPVYEGQMPTKIRAVLCYNPSLKTKKKGNEICICSNEFSASVNPGQFWRKPEYFPAGIMDPYVE